MINWLHHIAKVGKLVIVFPFNTIIYNYGVSNTLCNRIVANTNVFLMELNNKNVEETPSS
jgi:hypothetical protein